MRVLVTGANGFIGRAVCACVMQAGHFVCALGSTEKFSAMCDIYLPCDLGDPERLRSVLDEAQADCCIHLAWTGLPNYTYENSWISMRNSMHLLTIGHRAGIKHFIYAGSCFEYLSPKGKISEDWPIKNTDAYTAAKAGVLGLARRYCQEQQLCFHWPRFFYVMGPGQREASLIPYVVRSLKQGRRPVLRTAHNENDFIDVRDVAEALLAIAEKNPAEAEVLNIGSGQATSIRSLTGEIMCAFGLAEEPPLEERVPEVSFYADITKMRQLTGWEPRIVLSQSIRDCIGSF